MSRQRPETKNAINFRVVAIIIIAILVIGLGWTTVLLSKGSTTTNKLPSPTPAPSNPQPSLQGKVTRGVTGRTVPEIQKDALSSAVKILNDADISPTGANAKDRLTALEAKNYKVIDKSLINSVYFAPNPPDGLKVSSYESLVTLSQIIKQQTGKTTVAAISPDAYKAIYVDSKLGTAFVPLSTVAGNGAVFSFEMVYVDNAWKLAPFSLVNQIQISSILSANQNAPTVPSAPTK